MPIVPVRGLAEKGILRDPSPYQLDLNAWSAGANVRFHANKAERAPAFRNIVDTIVEPPTFCVGLEPSTGQDKVMIVGESYRIFEYGSSTFAEVSPTNLAAFVITNGGTLYVTPPLVTFTAAPAGGTTATATTTLTAGVVTAITLTNVPRGYIVAPTVTIAAGPGVRATATVALAFTGATDPRAVTATFLGDVLYLNRPDRIPVYYGPLSTNFATLPNQEEPWTCRSLRAYGNFLIAMNVVHSTTWVDPHTGLTIQGGHLANLVKWSDLTLEGSVPGSWDPFDPTKNTGENPLEELNSPLVDGLPMREVFVLYSETQIWEMQQNGQQSIFTFRKMFDEGGMIAPNCVVEVDGVHYVFGTKDIYKHDGTQKVSIIDKRNRQFVFRNLNKLKSEVCHVYYRPQFSDIVFAFNTGESTATFQNCDRCNYGAVYDLSADTWTFIDLPNTSASTQANLDTTYTYAACDALTDGLPYSVAGGSYYDQDNTYPKSVVGVSSEVSGLFTKHRLLASDFFDKGSLAFAYEPEVNAPAYLERTGIALDQFGSDLTTFKKIRRIFPLVNTYEGTSMSIEVGGSNVPAGAVTWSPAVTFDPTMQYKVDGITGGRYLALRFTVEGPQDFEVAGFDLDVTDGGRR